MYEDSPAPTAEAAEEPAGPAPYIRGVRITGMPYCVRMVPSPPSGQPAHCTAPLASAGTVTYTASGSTWRAFACADHRDGLDDAHPMTAEDRVYLAGLRRQWDRGLAGKPYARPEPLRRL